MTSDCRSGQQSASYKKYCTIADHEGDGPIGEAHDSISVQSCAREQHVSQIALLEA